MKMRLANPVQNSTGLKIFTGGNILKKAYSANRREKGIHKHKMDQIWKLFQRTKKLSLKSP